MVFVWISMIFLSAPLLSYSGTEAEKTEIKDNVQIDNGQTKKDEPIVITSVSLIADTKQNIVTFVDHVKAVKGNMVLLADKMEVKYFPETGKVKDIKASGSITLTKGSNVIKSDIANYDSIDDKVIFTGNLSARVGKNIITGTKIIFYINNERSLVENSKVRVLN